MKTIVLWFTGLSGSGKSTIAGRLVEMLSDCGVKTKLLDGDQIRNSLHRELRFTPEDIKKNNNLIAEMCKEAIGDYGVVIVSVITPFRISRRDAREMLSPYYAEVYIKADLQECIRRDVKGLYKRAIAGEIENFIGVSENTPYEEPIDPEIVLDTQVFSVDECVEKVVHYMKSERGVAI